MVGDPHGQERYRLPSPSPQAALPQGHIVYYDRKTRLVRGQADELLMNQGRPRVSNKHHPPRQAMVLTNAKCLGQDAKVEVTTQIQAERNSRWSES